MLSVIDLVGASQSKNLFYIILLVSEPSADAPSSDPPVPNKNLTVIIIVGAVTAVILIVSIIIVASIVACRKPEAVKRRTARRSSKPPEEFDLSEDGFGEGFHRRSAQYRASMYGECEERISRMIEGKL